MERQYIGARYVPKFFENPNTGDSTWLSGVAYEALTIVTIGGNSYTSKKPVPAGIGAPNSNPEYWVATGIFNEQIESIRQQLNQAETDINNLETNVAEQGSVIASEQIRLGKTNKNIANIKKRIVCIGDSYNYDGAGWIGWGTTFKNKYPWYDVFVAANPGGGFVTVANNRTFTTELEEIYPTVTDPEGITDVIVMGGYNDMSMAQTRPDIVTAMSLFKNKANELFPNAKIHVAYIGADHRMNGNQAKCFTYAAYYEYGCSVNGLTFIPNMQYTLLVSDYIFYADGNPNSGFHPTSDGTSELARHLMLHLQGSIPDIRYEYTVGTVTIGLHNDRCYCIGNAGANPPQIVPGNGSVSSGQWIEGSRNYGEHIWWGKPSDQLSGGFQASMIFHRISDKSTELLNVKYYNGHFYFSQNTSSSVDLTGLYGGFNFMVPTRQMY